ncbi:MAG: arylesterase [Gammaproteobacteria bacterium]|nr:arylesterase [Gammaproteobacteria bacterium]MDH3768626.1 arylesterase [Gammaproteobacteria bacterium]
MSKWSFVLLLLANLAACAGDKPAAPLAVAGDDNRPVILIVGDSLSAGYGIELEQGWVSLLQQRLDSNGHRYRVFNASITGDTTSGGLARLKTALSQHTPALVVIELGGNDGLRGIPLQVVESNLNAMIKQSETAGARVALLGMRIPTNYGPRYAEKFHRLYQDAARHHDVSLVKFFMDGVALDASLMQSDGVHPNAAAQPRLLDNAWPAIKQALTTR